MKTFMIVEKFHPEKIQELYRRFDEKGRMLPMGVVYINSWINEQVDTCYQLMEAVSVDSIYEWIENWKDVADFEVQHVISTNEARAKVLQ